MSRSTLSTYATILIASAVSYLLLGWLDGAHFRQSKKIRFRSGPAITYGPGKSDLLNYAILAQQYGEYPQAEQTLLLLRKLDPDLPDLTCRLARLYDDWGRDRDAYREWNTVFEGFKTKSISDRTNPPVLARYGDLCVKFGDVERSFDCYKSAIANAPFDDQRRYPFFSVSDARNRRELKALAHYAAGTMDWNKQLNEMKIAVSLMPNEPKIRFAYAHALSHHRMLDDFKIELKRAESLATGAYKKYIHSKRVEYGHIKTWLRIDHDENGKPVHTTGEYPEEPLPKSKIPGST